MARKGGAKGAGNDKFDGPPVPKALQGKARATTAGEPFCYGYSLGGCDKAKDGEKCWRGWYLCMETGCGKPHPTWGHAQHA